MPLPLAALLALAQQPTTATTAELTQPEVERMAEEIRAQIEELRGQKFAAPVPVSLADKPAFLAYAAERERAFSTPAQLRTTQLALELLGALDPGVDLAAVELELMQKQVSGFYAPERDRFYLMSSAPRAIARTILSHELTHALDDQLYDIDALLQRADGGDARAAAHAVIEGSANALMQQWQTREEAAGRLKREDLAAAQSMDGLDRAPEAVWKPLLHSYAQGQAFLAQPSAARASAVGLVTAADIERAFRAPPRSTEQVLHPEKYWSDARRDEPRRVRFAFGALPEGWTQTGEDTLGELGLAIAAVPRASRQRLSVALLAQPRFTNAAAEGWDGDRVAVFERAGGSALVLHTVWDSAADAQQFADAVAALRDASIERSVERVGELELQVWAWRAADPAPLRAVVSARVEADPLAPSKERAR
ncbi:MAG: hypothetical protein EPO68_13430 [Planctomycetota bacterium]|nr:MAG: hypothetical protein EPO68_13430 [Planctomycetota bacterium]